ncbi:hypothetical protein Nitsa_1825 [Nitratifractor salsuginis DSM 16511]|uniref:Uncharacterized protein n=1 Tax=Nitratifractor salsuginis (strain DSM 16511 / JCM 12458 / E9I37-1) TaxID=749222 RepID=E6X1S9_NITSE|nr:hypothetical protein Nitsa_1825 [Nitratifractor salsuginis DSM 16511]
MSATTSLRDLVDLANEPDVSRAKIEAKIKELDRETIEGMLIKAVYIVSIYMDGKEEEEE